MAGRQESRRKERSVREESVEQYLRRKVEQAGGRCEKFHPEERRGWPDRIVLLPDGVLVWVETKRPVGGVLSSAQRVAHEDLRRLGQCVVVLRSREEVDEFLDVFCGHGGYSAAATTGNGEHGKR